MLCFGFAECGRLNSHLPWVSQNRFVLVKAARVRCNIVHEPKTPPISQSRTFLEVPYAPLIDGSSRLFAAIRLAPDPFYHWSPLNRMLPASSSVLPETAMTRYRPCRRQRPYPFILDTGADESAQYHGLSINGIGKSTARLTNADPV